MPARDRKTYSCPQASACAQPEWRGGKPSGSCRGLGRIHLSFVDAAAYVSTSPSMSDNLTATASPNRNLLRGLLLHEVKRAGAAYDAETFVAGACALRILELGLDIVTIIIALPSEDSTGIFP